MPQQADVASDGHLLGREVSGRLWQILDGLFAFVGVLSVDGVLLEVNRAPLEAAGIKREEVLGMPFDETVWWAYSPEAQLQVREMMARAAEGEIVRCDATIRVTASRDMVVDLSIGPLYDETGRIAQLVASAVDITERKKLEEQFLRAQRVEAIGTLANGIAHDLNNILAPMLMAAGLLKDKLTAPHDKSIAAIIENGAHRGAEIIRQLLTFSRGVEGSRGLLQARHLIGEMEHLARETFPRNIEIVSHAPSDLWTVVGNATQLQQVLMNLCVNARDAMPDGGRLSLSAENRVLSDEEALRFPQAKPGRYLRLTVADSGHGIPPEIIGRIFDPFFTTKGIGHGTGLGLSTVMGIVKNHGGFVAVRSEPGKGTAFEAYLPASKAATPESSEAPPLLPAGRGELILLVDDEEPIRDSVQQVLRKHNYRVLTAPNGAEAVKIYLQNRGEIRLVLTDVMMPIMDGVDMIRSLSIMEPRLRVVAMSGLDEKSRRDELATLRVTEILGKPCDSAQLLQAIHRELVPAV